MLGQVPAPHPKFTYLLVGSGRLATHLRFWLSNTGHSWINWSRDQEMSTLYEYLQRPSLRLLLAISDDAIDEFYQTHLKPNMPLGSLSPIHFSGSLHIPDLVSAHPLMSFGPQLYSMSVYEEIHWTLCASHSSEKLHLRDLFPGLQNNFSLISAEEKPLYHAACVLGGNFPILLWQEMSRILQNIGIPAQAHPPYLRRCLENFIASPDQAFTGPLARGDARSIQRNLEALETSSNFAPVYQAFVHAFHDSSKKTHTHSLNAKLNAQLIKKPKERN